MDDGPTSKLIRQILGAVSEFDKAMIVAKLRGRSRTCAADQRQMRSRKSYAEAKPELVQLSRTSIADEMREEHRRRVLGD